MSKMNLPVLLIEKALLPHNDIKIDIENDIDKTILDEAQLFHDNRVLLVVKKNNNIEMPDINDLPNIGIIAKISKKIDLPTEQIRVTFKGLNRGLVHEYLFQNGTIESITSTIVEDRIEQELEGALTDKLLKELKDYMEYPNVSNSILAEVSKLDNLNIITDKIAYHLNLENDRLLQYLVCYNALKRTELALEDIYKLKELSTIENNLDVKVKTTIDQTQKEFYLKEKLKAINEELGTTPKNYEEINNYLNQVDKLKAKKEVKEEIKKVIKNYEILGENSLEIGVYKNYIDLLLSLPWDLKTKNNVTLSDVKKKLDDTHFGLEEAKTRIIEHLAVQKKTGKNKGSIICLVGPSGVGKTTLAYSIAKSIDANFTKISVGGVNDSSEILGHRQTYLGASSGRIIEGIKNAKSSNPVFLIDEIDKMSSDYKGDPVAALLEVLDTKQNKTFKDNYLKIPYDLSNVMFILTANDEALIPTALKDRLEIIRIDSYTDYEKIEIARNYLIPKIASEYNLNLTIKDSAIKTIINNYTSEAGVRELERLIEKIFRKVITNMVLNSKDSKNIKVDEKDLEKYLGSSILKPLNYLDWNTSGVVNSLAVSSIGGLVLPIEVVKMPGNGTLTVTGILTDVMKESVVLAFNYVKSNYEYFDIDYNLFKENDIHVHIPSSIKKDGLSAGIAITLAIISSLKNQKMSNNLALTGEITLTGRVMPVGGLKEKCAVALLNDIKNIYVSKYNKEDILKIDESITNKLNIKYVNDFKEIYKSIMEENLYE